jgi:type II secretory pathway pseudopilin PulG
MKRKGLTLIELVAVIVVTSLAIPVLLRLFADVAKRTAQAETMAASTFYAEQLMEEIKTKRFDENTTAPWSTTFGPDTAAKGLDGINNETTTNKSNWNDVDDFDGYSDNPVAGYTRSVAVVYLDPSVAPGGTWQALSSGTSDYKRVTVTVTRGALGSTSLATIIASD